MPDSPQVPGYIAARLADLPQRPEVHNALDVLFALEGSSDQDTSTDDGYYRTVSGELLATARAMLRCVAHHGDPEGHMEKFLGIPGGRSPEDLLSIVQVWIDSVAPAWTGGVDRSEAIFTFVPVDEDQNPIGIEHMPPYRLLAARLITARLGLDHDQFCTLAQTALKQGPRHLVNGAVGVLELCARAVQGGA